MQEPRYYTGIRDPMAERSLSAIKLAALLAAGTLLLTLHDASFLSSLGGSSLLLILFAYDGDSERSMLQSLAFGFTGGLAAALVVLPFLGYLPVRDLPVPAIVFAWAAASVVIFLVDRVRTPSVPRQPHSQSLSFTPPQTVPHAAPGRSPESVAPRLVREEAPAVTPTPSTPPPAPLTTPPFPPPPPPSPAAPIPIPVGKLVDIYVNLMGEGMVMLRTVKAVNVGRDFYQIVDEMPANERWEFGPGQVVRCQKRNLSNGKGLVAIEEAPRAQ